MANLPQQPNEMARGGQPVGSANRQVVPVDNGNVVVDFDRLVRIDMYRIF